MNKAILIGNLTKDVELTTTGSGISVAKFSIAVQRRFANAEGEREADFINIVVWRGQADNCHKFLKKGSKVGIVGAIQTRSYDGQDGTKRYATEVVAEEVQFLSTKKNEEGGAAPELTPIDDDGLPF